jgi:octaprenyl-diphosphate synthase
MHLGTAFQIIDDVLDYSSEEAATGKHLGDDLAEGKPTLPLIFAMQKGSPEQAAQVRQAIENGGRDDFARVLDIIRDTGALDLARERADQEARLAIAEMDAIPSSIFKDALLKLSLFAVERNH